MDKMLVKLNEQLKRQEKIRDKYCKALNESNGFSAKKIERILFEYILVSEHIEVTKRLITLRERENESGQLYIEERIDIAEKLTELNSRKFEG